MTTFAASVALLFTISATITVVWCTSMSAMGGMPMPGGWTMSMMWMRMPGQTWIGVAATFLGMWLVMMVAMMLPALVMPLLRYRDALAAASEVRPGEQVLLVGVGYFSTWLVVGLAIFLFGVALAHLEMQQPSLSRAVPIASGLVVLLAGAFQFSAWKSRQLACCRKESGFRRPAAGGWSAWRHGLRYGLDCGPCCANLMAILLVVGVMDLYAMAGVTAAIAVERFAPASERAARAIGAVAIAAGLSLIARAAA
jgi:predicted metal-binding membrane protein